MSFGWQWNTGNLREWIDPMGPLWYGPWLCCIMWGYGAWSAIWPKDNHTRPVGSITFALDYRVLASIVLYSRTMDYWEALDARASRSLQAIVSRAVSYTHLTLPTKA